MSKTDYQLLKDIYESQERLEAKLDTRLLSIEKRLSTLEQWKWYLVGAIGVFTFTVGFLKEEITRKLGL